MHIPLSRFVKQVAQWQVSLRSGLFLGLESRPKVQGHEAEAKKRSAANRANDAHGIMMTELRGY
jgi:hypothetical protein